MANKQVGQPLRRERPPEFANFSVRGGTWEEEDATKSEPQPNVDEETFNLSFYDRGRNAKCEMFANEGYELEVGDVLPELATVENPNPVDWVVVAPLGKKNFSGSRALIYVVNLMNRDALDTNQVTV